MHHIQPARISGFGNSIGIHFCDSAANPILYGMAFDRGMNGKIQFRLFPSWIFLLPLLAGGNGNVCSHFLFPYYLLLCDGLAERSFEVGWCLTEWFEMREIVEADEWKMN
tara:strand:- start:850 stop:1179 length:330 start_codon:yes stop_codon:yes gene_type:complete